MRAERRGPGVGKLLVICISVALIFAALWFAFELFDGMFVKQPEPIPEPEPLPNSMMTGIVEGLPKSEYDVDAFSEHDGFITYSGKPKAKLGIDVSSHQGEIDWSAVAADGVEFAILRVGYRGYTKGEISLDEQFTQNVTGAQENGIAVGVYFFSQAITEAEAREEAQVVLDAIEGLEITYPVVFDWEDIEQEARTDGMDSVTLTACAQAFCESIEAAGHTAGIYFNQLFGYQEYNLLELRDYVFWLAEYKSAPTFYYDFDMWQYTHTGTVAGVGTDVDINLSFWEPKT